MDGENLNRVIRALNENSKAGNIERRSLLADYGGFGSSILVRSPGTSGSPDKTPGTFVLAVPLGADFAVDTALALAGKIQNRSMRAGETSPNILVAFLGDEKNELPLNAGAVSHKGLRDLVTLADMPENWVLCYLDANGKPGEMVIRHGIRGYLAPLDIVKPLPDLFNSRSIPWMFKIRFNVLYKLGLVEGPEPMFITWGDEINGFELSGTEPRPGEKTIDSAVLADMLYDYALSLKLPVLNPDIHYFSFTVPWKGIIFVSEGTTTALLVVMAGIFLLIFLIYSAMYNAVLLFHIQLFLRHLWIFILFLFLMTISIKASGLFYALLLRTFGPHAVYTAGTVSGNASGGVVNYAGAGLTVLLAYLGFILPSPALALIRFPRRAQLYGFSAVIFVVIGLFSAAFLDFSYVPIFLWALVFVFLGASVSNPIVVLLSALLVPLIALGVLRNIIETGDGRIAELFISSGWNAPENWWAAFQTALLSLPILLLLKRGAILFQKQKRKGLEIKPNRTYRLVLIPILIAVILGVMVLQIRLLPKPGIPPERRFITEGTQTGTADKIIDLSLGSVIFQDSRIITVRLEARGSPIRFDVSLESVSGESLPPVYSAPVPFERDDDGKKIIFSLGEHPPDPLVMEIVVPWNFEGSLDTAAIYNSWDPALDPGTKPVSPDYTLTVTRKAKVGNSKQ